MFINFLRIKSLNKKNSIKKRFIKKPINQFSNKSKPFTKRKQLTRQLSNKYFKMELLINYFFLRIIWG